ncbi:MAG: hypothetical protein HYX24_07195 [Candidatus Aenigmarchaeota archaeon]|nr:hypothetical protein [Candidatus Aenigmarchaeota archaeon]
MSWLNEIPEYHRKSIDKTLTFCSDFPGMAAAIGSSVNEKYPLGEDIDIAMVGFDTKQGMQYTWKIYQRVFCEISQIAKLLQEGESIDNMRCPLLIEVWQRLDDPFVAAGQELIEGHGGSCIKLGYLPFPIGTKRFSPKYLETYRQRGNTPYRTRIDLIIDYSFTDRGLEDNITDWKRGMEKAKQRFIEITR